MKKLWSIICVLFGMIFVAGCSSTWVGTGWVVDKNYHEAGYRTVSWSQKNEWQPECYELLVKAKSDGAYHRGCVKEQVWRDAMWDHEITLSEQTKAW
jgi:hypothetical protein